VVRTFDTFRICRLRHFQNPTLQQATIRHDVPSKLRQIERDVFEKTETAVRSFVRSVLPDACACAAEVPHAGRRMATRSRRIACLQCCSESALAKYHHS
jgi:histone H3/H4